VQMIDSVTVCAFSRDMLYASSGQRQYCDATRNIGTVRTYQVRATTCEESYSRRVSTGKDQSKGAFPPFHQSLCLERVIPSGLDLIFDDTGSPLASFRRTENSFLGSQGDDEQRVGCETRANGKSEEHRCAFFSLATTVRREGRCFLLLLRPTRSPTFLWVTHFDGRRSFRVHGQTPFRKAHPR
jgi:hypothetical protein